MRVTLVGHQASRAASLVRLDIAHRPMWATSSEGAMPHHPYIRQLRARTGTRLSS